MSHNKPVNNETINAFIDSQLATEERMQVFDALKQDQELSQELCELQRNDEFLRLTYKHIPEPAYDPFIAATRTSTRQRQAIAAGILVILSAFVGWQTHTFIQPDHKPNIQEISQLSTGEISNNHILIHISAMDEQRINNALDKAEQLLSGHRSDDLTLEIVANADGLGLLRAESPYKSRIQKLAQRHKNVSFKACGIAMSAAKLKEGKEVNLLPEADKVPAALDQILKRLEAGWLYVRT